MNRPDDPMYHNKEAYKWMNHKHDGKDYKCGVCIKIAKSKGIQLLRPSVPVNTGRGQFRD